MKLQEQAIIAAAKDIEFRANHKTILQPVSLEIRKGETVVVTGPSGSGKTTLARLIAGDLHPTHGAVEIAEKKSVVFVPQQDRFIASAGLRTTYYGQRYESANDEGIPTVLEFFKRRVPDLQEEEFTKVTDELEIGYLSDRRILSLSNGERKRVQLAVALLNEPDLLVLDQPFIGLDVHARETLSSILEHQKRKGLALLVVSDPASIPAFADWVVEMDEGHTKPPVHAQEYLHLMRRNPLHIKPFNSELLTQLSTAKTNYRQVVQMTNVQVAYGGKKVLDNIDWEVNTGERWVLSGHNGAGKTTLLSLITADNPQGYSNHLILFDRRRGSGETVWEIKEKIGFVSPELHLYFLRHRGMYKPTAGSELSYNSLTCADVVLSGFKDEVGFNTTNSKIQHTKAKQWLEMLGMENIGEASFLHASLGEQRTILLARALVKSPDLLILDEPCQGLDSEHTRRFIGLLDQICGNDSTTMIYVTHRKEEIPGCITHALELENGRIKSQGKIS
ncbi:ATP-binding cassette domain-containing protein [Maribellus sp. YY47]|uniref:ATP-binding cassette domain-containing protein n=1 Tax=Maribellus sp. YY47 TaxID=2929486 RepID=UPI002001A925|nr:ATP-binding cassette domain-containing protein [Maribellus sp. YY47]MCK3685658.1 ATP-binding cassette domain-containing protein [Maribellus sp. YY47]